ncbi:MAG: carboxypeptidase-like regulatory domain-containing protein [Tannerellaceae bacterium]|nr:carboxypeptidase-like regulatory domain-containing protein [Tannerellaceae bacterium]
MPFGTVGLRKYAIGTITNLNGEFRLRLPDSLQHTTIHFSHLGYEPQEFECTLLENRHSTITLEPRIIPLQEVVVRLVNPVKLLEEMHRNLSKKLFPVSRIPDNLLPGRY